MISGRGLGHTARNSRQAGIHSRVSVDLSLKEFRAVLDTAGFAMNGQTAEIAPADKSFTLCAMRPLQSKQFP